MSAIPLSIKHAGKTYPLEVEPEMTGLEFKGLIYSVTGVPVERMKVMLKTGLLKDDQEISKLKLKPNQPVTVIGTAGELPKAPTQKMVFMEDMTDQELAKATRTPVGLVNLGNTCYAAASVQALKGIPELASAVEKFNPAITGQGFRDPQVALTSSIKMMWDGMGKTSEGYSPMAFIHQLRTVAPQFAEHTTHGNHVHYAQQDADECWTTIFNALDNSLPSSTAGGSKSFVSEYMKGQMVQTLTCDEAPDEAPTVRTEQISKLDCNISITTNYMHTGILDSLDQKIEKNSPSLGRTAVYSQKSRLSRLPSVLTVHMVRFYWRREISSKAKIMRKVKFPFDFDVMEMCSDELKAKLLPVNVALKNVMKDRDERAKIRKRARPEASSSAAITEIPVSDNMAVDGVADAKKSEAEVYNGSVAEEKKKREEEAAMLKGLVHPDIAADVGSNSSGLYELCGIVTHKGSTADSGHYIGWVKAAAPASDGLASSTTVAADEQWYKFDDDKVSLVKRDKITGLEGGGEDSAAYILVYRSVPLE